MPGTQIALQLYTLRDFCKTAADFATSMKKVKQIGYGSVQVSGIGPIDPGEVKRILDGEGLSCCVTHVGFDRMKSEPQKVIDEHKLWNCKYTAIGGFGWGDVSAKIWSDFIDEFNVVADNLARGGLKLGYHNHSHEYAKFDGKTVMQMLLEKASKSVWFEIDTYWVQHGGGDPVQWIDKVAGRIPCVHLKDMAVTPDRKQVMAEVGEGNLNWPGIIAACRKAGVEWYIVEQDDCNGVDPFVAVATSLRNVKAMGLK